MRNFLLCLLACVFGVGSSVQAQAPTAVANTFERLATAALRAEARVAEGAAPADAFDADADDIRQGAGRRLSVAQRYSQGRAARGIRYRRGQVRVELDPVSAPSGDTAEATGRVRKTFDIEGPEGAPATVEGEERYRFSFARAGNRWTLTDFEIVDPFGQSGTEVPTSDPGSNAPPPSTQAAIDGPPTAPTGESEEERGRSRRRGPEPDRNRGPAPGEGVQGAYSASAAAAYARQYAYSYNTAYRSFAGQGQGGDCTNFISQALRAGGWPDVGGYFSRTSNSSWWYDSFTQSYTWAGAHNHYFFQRDSGRAFRLSYLSSAIVGDVIQVDFDRDGYIDHTVLVTKKDASSNLYVTYHSSNWRDRPFVDFQTASPGAAYYAWGLWTSY